MEIEAVVRQHHGRLVAAIASRFSDIALAEDALQDAVIEALSQWSIARWPPNPPAWLMTVASRKAIDRLRRQAIHQTKLEQLEVSAEIDKQGPNSLDHIEEESTELPDHRLKLIFTCCHPAIAEKNRSALILKVICGLSTEQIARAWLVSETTMAQRLVRTKRKITKAGIPFSIPEKTALPNRLGGVLEVIYLIFNAGYQSSESNELINTDLCEEALYLGKLLMTLMPDETEVVGLVALMLFHHSRIDARISDTGKLVAMGEQNRSLWNREQIAIADKILKGALMKGRPGPYQIQAAISAIHCHAATMKDTDWQQILMLYHQLELYTPSPVVKVNLAVALSFAEGPQQGICYLDQLPDLEKLSSYHPYHVARSDMLARSGQAGAAAEVLRTAISLTSNRVETEYLQQKLAKLEAVCS